MQQNPDGNAPLKRKRLVKAGESVKRRAVESLPAPAASPEAAPAVKPAGVGGLAFVPLPKPKQPKELHMPDEDAPYWFGHFGAAFGPQGTGHPGTALAPRNDRVLSNAAQYLRAGQPAVNQTRAVAQSPSYSFGSPDHVSLASPTHMSRAESGHAKQSGYAMSPGGSPTHSMTDQDAGQASKASVPMQAALHASGHAQLPEQSQHAMHEPQKRPDQELLGAEDDVQELRHKVCVSEHQHSQSQDCLGHQHNAKAAEQKLEGVVSAPEQRADEQGVLQQQPSQQGLSQREPQSQNVQEQHQPYLQQGASTRQQAQQLPSSFSRTAPSETQSQGSHAVSDTPPQALEFGIWRSEPISAEPESFRMKLRYSWGYSSSVTGVINLQAHCWTTKIVGKYWKEAGKFVQLAFVLVRVHMKPQK